MIRVLHVVGGLDVGGTETWLASGLPYVDRERYAFDFLVFGDGAHHYASMIEQSGGRIVRCCGLSRPVAFAWSLLGLLRRNRYHAVHAHIYCASALVLLLAAVAGVKVRVFQSHTAQDEQNGGGWRRWYFRVSRWLIRRCATRSVAVSVEAATAFFPKNWRERPERWSISPIGIDLTPFLGVSTRETVRREFNVPKSALLVVHVGRFAPVKNHALLVRVAEHVVRERLDVVFLLVGDGPERASVQRQVEELGLAEHFLSAGLRDDVARLLRACDVFVLPSLYEGFPLAYVEAQAAGLPCVISDAIAPAADRLPGRIMRLSVHDNPACWARAVLESAAAGRASFDADAFREVSIQGSMERMVGCYQ